MVSDLDLVNPTVMRPKQSSVSSVGSISIKWPLRKPVLGGATMATAAVPPAEGLAMVSTRSAREKFFLIVDLLRLFGRRKSWCCLGDLG